MNQEQHAPELVLKKPASSNRTSVLIGLAIGLLGLSWYWWGKIVFFYILVFIIGLFLLPLRNFLLSQIWDSNEKFFIESTLQQIWKRAGVIEIKGGAETGKSLLIILLTKYLKGKVWTNIPNNLPGCQILNLETIQQIYQGNYSEGMTGQNNLLFIDDSWDFFSRKELIKYDLTHRLSDLLLYLSETSKNGLKVFYVSKQGAKLPNAFSLLSANRSALIKTQGKRFYCRFFNKSYYYLDIRLDKQVISIPFSQDDYKLFDHTWNQDRQKAQERMISIANKLEADELTKILGHKQSRSERLEEEAQIDAYAKKHFPELVYKNVWKVLRKKGWKPASERLNEEEQKLEKLKTDGKITDEEYEEEKAKLSERRTKYERKIERNAKKKSSEEKVLEEPIVTTEKNKKSKKKFISKKPLPINEEETEEEEKDPDDEGEN